MNAIATAGAVPYVLLLSPLLTAVKEKMVMVIVVKETAIYGLNDVLVFVSLVELVKAWFMLRINMRMTRVECILS